MDGLPEINRNQPTREEEKKISTKALPPPVEVKIRTMKSDVAGLAASGGGMPHFENVSVPGLSLNSKGDQPSAAFDSGKKSQPLVIAVITIVALIVLGALIYFAYKIIGS